jgi:hypothetical protein
MQECVCVDIYVYLINILLSIFRLTVTPDFTLKLKKVQEKTKNVTLHYH